MAGYVRQSSGDIVDGGIIEAVDLNDEFNQLQAAFDDTTGHAHDGTTGNGPQLSLSASLTGTLPIANGGTNAVTESAARTSLGLAIGTDVQAFDAGLLSIAGLTTAADKMIYTTASDTYAVTDLSVFARTILDDANAAAVRTTIGTVIGTDVQAWDTDLDTYAANPLTAAELGELQNIGATTISTAQWVFVGGLDQALTTTSDVTFAGFTSTGIDDNATGTILTVGDTAVSSTQQFLVSNGSAGTPGFSFDGDTNTGMYRAAADQLAFAAGGLRRLSYQNNTWDFNSNRLIKIGTAELNDGMLATPSITFTSDLDTGMYRPGTDSLEWVTGGTAAVTIDSSQDFDFHANDISTTGDLTTAGFTSTGIDDNASSVALTIDSSEDFDFMGGMFSNVGDMIVSGTRVNRTITTSSLELAGSTDASKGSRIILYGSTHGSQALDFEVLGGSTVQIHYDDSASLVDFQANDLTTTGTISEGGALLSNTYLALAGGDLSGNITYAIDEGVTTVLNFNNGNTGEVSIAGNTTFTFSNIPATGQTAIYTFFLVVTSTATPTFTGVTDWNGGSAPGALAVGKYIFTFTTHDGGTVLFGIQSFSSV